MEEHSTYDTFTVYKNKNAHTCTCMDSRMIKSQVTVGKRCVTMTHRRHQMVQSNKSGRTMRNWVHHAYQTGIWGT